MHMADALISPAVGGIFWGVTAVATVYATRKLKRNPDDRRPAFMGVLGAFIFAAQMINFTIPATGSSGHIGGGLLLSILLGPPAAFITIASVLVVQALFFADGGLLALGCNIFNMGFIPAFIVYPLIYKPLAGRMTSGFRAYSAAVAAAAIGMVLGAFGVVVETISSGITDLPFSTFVLLMLPIHLAIGIVEGFVTVGVVSALFAARPDIIPVGQSPVSPERKVIPRRTVLAGIAVTALLIGGVVSWFASSRPDGLEWALFKTSGAEEPESRTGKVHETFLKIQEKTSILPDYELPEKSGEKSDKPDIAEETGTSDKNDAATAVIDAGTSLSGVVGGGITLAIAFLAGFALRKGSRKPEPAPAGEAKKQDGEAATPETE